MLPRVIPIPMCPCPCPCPCSFACLVSTVMTVISFLPVIDNSGVFEHQRRLHHRRRHQLPRARLAPSANPDACCGVMNGYIFCHTHDVGRREQGSFSRGNICW